MTPINKVPSDDLRVHGPRSEPPLSIGDDPLVAAALEEFLAELKAGRRPDRAEFLARHAAIAPLLAESLDGLLIVHSAAPALVLPEAPLTAEYGLPPSAVIGDYRLIRELGRGGMGVVYEAEQISLG